MGSSPYRTALETLRRCQQGFAAGVAGKEREQLIQLHAEALELLQERPRRLATDVLARRVRRLTQQMVSYPPGRRAAAIRERLGLSKARYYRLMKIAESP